MVVAASGQDIRMSSGLVGEVYADEKNTKGHYTILFRQRTKGKIGKYLRDHKLISYTILREQFKVKMRYLCYQADSFEICSLRAGGASAVANTNVPDCLF